MIKRFSLVSAACLRPTVENQPRGALGVAGGITVALAGRNDGPLHQHVPYLRELFWIAQLGSCASA